MSRNTEATLIITFENDGKTVHKATEGFQGKDCESITDFIEKALSATNQERSYTREYYDDDRRKEDRLRV